MPAPLLRRALLCVSPLLLVAGCDDREAREPRPVSTSDGGTIERDVAGIERDVRLEQATKRIEALEREVALLRTTPATIEVGLLTERVQALEARQAAAVDAPVSRPTPGKARRAPLVLPELEKR